MNSDELRTALLAGDLSRPRLTWYDDGTGERIDLSGKTLLNWVAKAGNWLDLEMGLAPGDELALVMPPNHWRTIYWSLAGWSRGLTVHLETADADAVVTMAGIQEHNADADLEEPPAALAASPLQAMSDTMPPPAGPTEYDELALPGDVPTGSRVLLRDIPVQHIPATAAALIGHGCSVVLVRGADSATATATTASEGVDIAL